LGKSEGLFRVGWRPREGEGHVEFPLDVPAVSPSVMAQWAAVPSLIDVCRQRVVQSRSCRPVQIFVAGCARAAALAGAPAWTYDDRIDCPEWLRPM